MQKNYKFQNKHKKSIIWFNFSNIAIIALPNVSVRRYSPLSASLNWSILVNTKSHYVSSTLIVLDNALLILCWIVKLFQPAMAHYSRIVRSILPSKRGIADFGLIALNDVQ